MLNLKLGSFGKTGIKPKEAPATQITVIKTDVEYPPPSTSLSVAKTIEPEQEEPIDDIEEEVEEDIEEEEEVEEEKEEEEEETSEALPASHDSLIPPKIFQLNPKQNEQTTRISELEFKSTQNVMQNVYVKAMYSALVNVGSGKLLELNTLSHSTLCYYISTLYKLAYSLAVLLFYTKIPEKFRDIYSDKVKIHNLSCDRLMDLTQHLLEVADQINSKELPTLARLELQGIFNQYFILLARSPFNDVSGMINDTLHFVQDDYARILVRQAVCIEKAFNEPPSQDLIEWLQNAVNTDTARESAWIMT